MSSYPIECQKEKDHNNGCQLKIPFESCHRKAQTQKELRRLKHIYQKKSPAAATSAPTAIIKKPRDLTPAPVNSFPLLF